eukprot:symbB.v1.2.009924.t2/scaffold640.1/size177612/7
MPTEVPRPRQPVEAEKPAPQGWRPSWLTDEEAAILAQPGAAEALEAQAREAAESTAKLSMQEQDQFDDTWQDPGVDEWEDPTWAAADSWQEDSAAAYPGSAPHPPGALHPSVPRVVPVRPLLPKAGQVAGAGTPTPGTHPGVNASWDSSQYEAPTPTGAPTSAPCAGSDPAQMHSSRPRLMMTLNAARPVPRAPPWSGEGGSVSSSGGKSGPSSVNMTVPPRLLTPRPPTSPPPPELLNNLVQATTVPKAVAEGAGRSRSDAYDVGMDMEMGAEMRMEMPLDPLAPPPPPPPPPLPPPPLEEDEEFTVRTTTASKGAPPSPPLSLRRSPSLRRRRVGEAQAFAFHDSLLFL